MARPYLSRFKYIFHIKPLTGSDIVAISSLIISMATATFTFYQWRYGERESRIVAAIEISKIYADDKGAASVDALRALSLEKIGSDNWASKQRAGERSAQKFEYIASLINKGRLDYDYVSDELKCDISMAHLTVSDLVERGRLWRDKGFEELRRYEKERWLNGCISSGPEAELPPR